MAEYTVPNESYLMRMKISSAGILENMDMTDVPVPRPGEKINIELHINNMLQTPLTLENLWSLAHSVPNFHRELTGEEINPSFLSSETIEVVMLPLSSNTSLQEDAEQLMEVENTFMDSATAAAIPAPNTALSPEVLGHHGETLPPNGITRQPSSTSEVYAPLPDLETVRNNDSFGTSSEDHPETAIPLPESGNHSTFVHFQGELYQREISPLPFMPEHAMEGLWKVTDYNIVGQIVLSVFALMKVKRRWKQRTRQPEGHLQDHSTESKSTAEFRSSFISSRYKRLLRI